MASNFVKVGDVPYVINLDRVAFVDDARKSNNSVYVHFAAYDPENDDLFCVVLTGDNADRFMAMLDRQTGAW